MDEELIWEGRPTWRAWASDWIAGWVFLPLIFGAFMLIQVEIRRRSTRWKVTSKRIEIEHGLLERKIDTIELWRVKDAEYRQSLLERMVGVSRILVVSQDAGSPVMEIRGLNPDRTIYDRLMGAVMAARQQRGVLNVTN